MPRRLLLGLFALALPVQASEIALSYAAVERGIWATLLTDQGRHYFEGGPRDDCRYAFVQDPKVRAEGERLAVSFVFSGRAGTTIAGRCVGPGETLDIVVSGVPAYANGVLRLADVRVSAPGSSYFRLVAPVIQAGFERGLAYQLRSDVERALAAAAAGSEWQVRLVAFDVRSVRVESGRLVVTYETSVGIE